MNRIDLHTHSKVSDGSLSPWELVKKAASLGLTAIGLTDHDTIDGVEEALDAGREFGIRVVPGVELSVNHENGSIHLLGYGINHTYPLLAATTAHLCVSRNERNEKMLRKLNKLGYEITSGEVQRLAGMGTVGRGHIGQALVKSGYFSKVEYTFEFLLQYGAPAYEDRFRLNLRDAINLLHNAGGIAVWAHPGLLNPDKLERLIHRLPRWAEYGLDGIESDYSQHSLALCDCLRSLALGNGLIYTGGSDFHGELKPNIRLGDGPEGTPIDSVCLESLDERLEMVRDYLKKSSEYRL